MPPRARAVAVLCTAVRDMARPGPTTGSVFAGLIVGSALYGAALGSWHSLTLAFYCALKLPLVLLLTAGLTFGFQWLSTRLLGIDLPPRAAAGSSLRALAVAGTVLGGLSPLAAIFVAAAPPPGSEARTAHNLLYLTHTVSLTVYGAISGLFQGGTQVLEGALKAPLIVGATVVLCLPSLFVFTALSGVIWQGRQLVSVVTSYFALAGLVLLGLLPITWLFSVSSRYLGFVTLLHVGGWLLATVLAGRSLARLLRDSGGSGAALWTTLVFIVALQVATYLRPVLWREPEDGWRRTEKEFFLEHFLDSAKRSQPETATTK